MDDILWTPPSARVLPTTGKAEGGSWFDDELETKSERDRKLKADYDRMVDHLRNRPDHVVYVGDVATRDQLRHVFNHMFRVGVIRHHPDIKLDYGVPTGSIRILEDRDA